MSKLLDRLQSIQPSLVPCIANESNEWVWRKNLQQQDPAFFRPFIPYWQTLNLEYEVLKAQLGESLLHPHSKTLLKKQLVAALAYAELLEQLNSLINNPHAQAKLGVNQAIYHHYLRQMGVVFYLTPEDWLEQKRLNSISEKIRHTTATTNWPRLLLVRIKRLLDTMVPILKSVHNFKRVVSIIDGIANPLFAWLAWLFYSPRLAFNATNSLKNIVPHRWMRDEQRALGWQSRLSLQWQNLWFELCNDSIWLSVGLLNCFVLVGPLAPVALYLTIALYSFDILLAGIRAGLAFNRFNKIKKSYESMITGASEEDKAELQVYQRFCESQLLYEKARLWLSLATTTALFIGMCFAIPAFAAINPVIPFVGAIFIVTTCLISFYMSKKIEKLKPKSELPAFKDLPPISVFDEEKPAVAHPQPLVGLIRKPVREVRFDDSADKADTDTGSPTFTKSPEAKLKRSNSVMTFFKPANTDNKFPTWSQANNKKSQKKHAGVEYLQEAFIPPVSVKS